MKQVLHILVVDKTWAKLYRTAFPPIRPTLVFHHALFGWLPTGQDSDDELARSLCRMLRMERQSGTFQQLVMIASEGMLGALHLRYDGDWHDVASGGLEDLPPQYSDHDLARYVESLMTRRALSLQEEKRDEKCDCCRRKNSPDPEFNS